MATVERSRLIGAEHRFVLYGVPWEVYETLRESDHNYRVRMSYDRGTLEFMSPSQRHESLKRLVGRMVEALTEELSIPLKSLGSTTWKQKEKLKGLEPDECYYILNHPRIKDLDEIDLDVHPAPDLAIEVEVRRGAVKRMGIYAALGVPEIWRWHKGALRFYALTATGEYEQIETSLNLPMLQPKELEPFLDAKRAADESQWIRSFRQWVRERFGKSL